LLPCSFTPSVASSCSTQYQAAAAAENNVIDHQHTYCQLLGKLYFRISHFFEANLGNSHARKPGAYLTDIRQGLSGVFILTGWLMPRSCHFHKLLDTYSPAG
jgi:hypothetical protein